MSTPAAWHPDPTGVFEHRYWDGTRWTEHVAVRGTRGQSAVDADPADARRVVAGLAPPPPATVPTTAQAPAPAPRPAPASRLTPVPAATAGPDAYAIALPRTPDVGGPAPTWSPTGPPPPSTARPPGRTPVGRSHDGWMWALAAVPVALGVAQLVIGYDLPVLAALAVVGIMTNVGLALLDMRANPAITSRESTTLMAVAAFLLVPVYVFLRQRRLGRSQLPLLGYVAVAAVMVALPIVAGAANVIDAPSLEDEVEAWIRDTFDTQAVVDCPTGQPARPGHRFLCEVDDGIQPVNLRVEVLNRGGDVEWIVVG